MATILPPISGSSNGNRNGHGKGPNGNGHPDRRQQLWAVLLNAIFVIASVLVALPLLAIVRGFVELLYRRGDTGWQSSLGISLAFLALVMGAFFFIYSVKYYLATVVVLLTTLVSGRSARIGRGNGNGKNGNGNGHLGHYPFVSIHIAAYNEKRVIGRLLQACQQLDYPNYEVVVVDDSTDESIEILKAWRDQPRFKILHRPARKGFKGGALQEALNLTDRQAEYVVIWDADSLPFPDSIQRFLPHFYEPNGNGSGNGNGNGNGNGEPRRREQVAAVQSYQWHVLNKSESWLTEGVRTEYAGSYMIERPFQEALSSLKMVAGTSYMIRAEVLRQIGWGTSLTEDWELTLQLYSRGYKVVYTPYAETPAECVGTFARLARQRMRWAEGHSHNVRRWFLPILLSPYLTPLEKLEFVYYSAYYLQAFLLVVGSLCWLVSEVGLHAHVPDWTALLGWSLLFSNLLSLPLMNLGGLVLEEAPGKDLVGVLGALAVSYLLVPFQAWASLKGFFGRDEGPWYRTPKTGRITDPVSHLHRLKLLGRWLFKPRRSLGGQPPRPVHIQARPRLLGWALVGVLVLTFAALGWSAIHAPVAEAASGTIFYLHQVAAAPTHTTDFANTTGTLHQFTFSTTSPTNTWVTTTGTAAAQTIFAGTYTFTYYSPSTGTATWSVRFWIDNTASPLQCTGPGTTIASASITVTAPSTGPAPNTATFSGGQVNVPAGYFFCFTISYVSGATLTLDFDKATGSASTQRSSNLTVPQTIFIPEYGLALLGLALLAPLAMRLRRRRHA